MTDKKLAIRNPLAVSELRPEMLRTIDEADYSDWDRDAFIAAGEEATKVKYYSQWILGKLADEYSKKWGDCSRYGREIHVEPNSLIAYRRVYRKIKEANPEYVPDGFLTWGVLQIIAEQPEPIKLIEELSKEGKVTIAEVDRRIREKTGREVLPPKPRVALKFDKEKGLWDLEMDEKDFERINWEKVGRQLLGYLRKLWKE
jgi:hypothetical protein